MAEMTTSDYTNLASGAYSLIKGLTNKKPGKYKYTALNPIVRPAHGDEEGLRRAKVDIASQISGATRDVNRIAGSDANAALNARLGIQVNGSDAVVKAQAANSQLLRDDQNRVSAELNQAAQINNQGKNQQDLINFQVANERYEQRRQEAEAGVQRSLQYISDKDAFNKTTATQQLQHDNFIKAGEDGLYAEAYQRAIHAGATGPEAEQIARASIQKGIYGGTLSMGQKPAAPAAAPAATVSETPATQIGAGVTAPVKSAPTISGQAAASVQPPAPSFYSGQIKQGRQIADNNARSSLQTMQPGFFYNIYDEEMKNVRKPKK